MASCCVQIGSTTKCGATCGTNQTEACHTKADCPTPAANRKAACCPFTQTLRACRTFGNNMTVPANCN
jgi:hypothetical protein